MVKGKSWRKIDAAIALGMALVSAVEAGPKLFNLHAVPIGVGNTGFSLGSAKHLGDSTLDRPYGGMFSDGEPTAERYVFSFGLGWVREKMRFSMKKSMRKKLEERKEFETMVKMDAVAAGERILAQFSNEADRAIVKAHNAVRDEAIRKALLDGMGYYKRWYAWSNDMVQITSKQIYRREWKFHRLLTEQERDLWCRVDSRNSPSLPYPKEAEEVLARIRALREEGCKSQTAS